jgi:hypothetical protein
MQAIIALAGASVLAVVATAIAFYGSAEYFDWKYPHDGQNALGAVVVAIVVFPAVEGAGFIILFFLQRMRIQGSSTTSTSLPEGSGGTS